MDQVNAKRDGGVSPQLEVATRRDVWTAGGPPRMERVSRWDRTSSASREEGAGEAAEEEEDDDDEEEVETRVAATRPVDSRVASSVAATLPVDLAAPLAPFAAYLAAPFIAFVPRLPRFPERLPSICWDFFFEGRGER